MHIEALKNSGFKEEFTYLEQIKIKPNNNNNNNWKIHGFWFKKFASIHDRTSIRHEQMPTNSPRNLVDD